MPSEQHPDGETFLVTATSLHLRKAPRISADNTLARLPRGHEVQQLAVANSGWWQVTTTLHGQRLIGYVAARYLVAKADEPTSQSHRSIVAVHFATHEGARRSSTRQRYRPLAEGDLPRRDLLVGSAAKRAALLEIVAALAVDESARYRPTGNATGGKTYCNIYAYDYCYLAQAYLPRVWWKQKALVSLAQGRAVAVSYGKTVQELSANGLSDWLGEWGDDFGWRRTFDLTLLQTSVNEGKVAVISAKRRDPTRSGHITCVIPERPGEAAARAGTDVLAPRQSQAGEQNKPSFALDWWTTQLEHNFSDVGFWLHD